METIRILHVVTIMNRGGLETMLMNYYRKMDREKIQFDFMVNREHRGDYDDEIEELGGRIYRMPPIRPGNYRVYFKKLDDFFLEHTEYKVVHAHINENSSFVLRAAKKTNVPCRIAHSHLAGLPIDYKLPLRLYSRMYLKENANYYFSCSVEAGDWLFGKEIRLAKKLVIFKNAIDVEEFKFKKEKRKKLRKDLDIENKLVLGHVGRFNSQKNHHFLIDVFRHVYQKNENSILLLIGEGTLMESVRKKVKDLKLEQAVKFLGLRDDIPDLMNAMDLFIFPSKYEGLGVVLIESQASGLPSITSTGTPREANVGGKVEFLDLKVGASFWADNILSMSRDRENHFKKIITKGYDVQTNVDWLNGFYTTFYKDLALKR